jgi:hypothetical protein
MCQQLGRASKGVEAAYKNVPDLLEGVIWLAYSWSALY